MELTRQFSAMKEYLDSFTDGLVSRKVTEFKSARFFFGDADPAFKAFDDSQWQSVDLPHDYAVTKGFDENRITGGSGGYVLSGIAWYRIHLGELNCHNRFTVMFDGTGGKCDIWINDIYLGTRPTCHAPFWFDITPHLAFDGTDVITVKCDTSLQPYSRFYGGLGLTRSVKLVENGRVHLIPGSLYARQFFKDDEAEIEVHSEVSFLRDESYARTDLFEGESNRTARFVVITTVIDEDGNVAGESVMPACLVHCTGNYKLKQKIVINDPVLWSPENPYIYKIHTKIASMGRIYDDEIIPLGIRKLEKSAETGVLINGSPVKFKGVCLHQDSGYFGAAVPMKEWVRKLTVLRNMGCNAIRTAHHPYSDLFYSVADRMGFFVMDEAFDEWHRAWPRNYSDSSGGKNTYGYYLYFDQWARTDIEAFCKRNRRHPSVVMFSLGNEIPDYYYDDSPEIYSELKAVAKKFAPDLWLTEGSEGQCNLPLNEDMLELSDIVGLNYSDLRYHEKFYRPVHDKHPEWVMVGSENSHQGQHWKEVEKQTYVTGMFIWTGADYLGESGGYNVPSVYAEDYKGKELCHGSNSGKIDLTLYPKVSYYYQKMMWNDEPMVYPCVKLAEYDPWHFGSRMQARALWNYEDGKKITLYVMTNCDEAEIFLNDVFVARAKNDPDSAMPIEQDMIYHPGVLKVVGYRSGKRVCENTLSTYSEPGIIEPCPDSVEIQSGGDMVTVQFELRDKNGTLCQLSDRALKISVDNGEIFAVTSGNLADPSCNFGTDEFTLYRGRAQATFRSCEKGDMVIHASCNGIVMDDLVITVS